MNVLLFVMVAAIFVHTFLNFFFGIYTSFKIKASNFQPTELVTSLEDLFGNMFLGIFHWFKKLEADVKVATADVKTEVKTVTTTVATDVKTVINDVKKI